MEAVLHYFQYFLATVFVLGLIIVVHEFGHALVAKKAGMVVKEFSIGFGPRLWKRNWAGTDLTVRLLPIGGFVRIVGLEPSEWSDPDGFYAKPLLSRMAVLGAGGFFNLLCSFVLLTAVIWVRGVSEGASRVVERTLWGSPAHRAGIRKGDEVLGVNGKFCKQVSDIVRAVKRSAGKRLVLLVRREGRVMEVLVVPEWEWDYEVVRDRVKAKRVGRIGIVFQRETKRVGLVEAMKMAAQAIWKVTRAFRFFFQSLGRLFKPESVVGGPIAIVREAGMQAQLGLSRLLLMAAYLGAFVGILNLLPFPALDGGRLTFALLGAFRIRIHPLTEMKFHLVGMVILLLFIALVTAQDIWRLGQ